MNRKSFFKSLLGISGTGVILSIFPNVIGPKKQRQTVRYEYLDKDGNILTWLEFYRLESEPRYQILGSRRCIEELKLKNQLHLLCSIKRTIKTYAS